MSHKIPARCGPGDILKATFGKGAAKKKAASMGCGCMAKASDGPVKLLPRPQKGDLGAWMKDLSADTRHKALSRVVKRRGCKETIYSLTLLHNISDDPETKAKAQADAYWLHNQKFCRLKTK